MSSVRDLYDLAASLEEQAASVRSTDPHKAVECYEQCLSICNRLVLVESKSQKQELENRIGHLQEKLTLTTNTLEYCIANAMQLHQQAQRMERDEKNTQGCIEAYTEAGLCYLQALRYAETQANGVTITKELKTQVEYIIKYTESLKKRLQVASTFQQHATDQSLEIDDVRKRLRAQKSSQSDGAATYSSDEVAVLRGSSLINGHIYLPWIDAKDRLTLPSMSSTSMVLYEDPDGLLALSPSQLRKHPVWKRPHDFCRDPQVIVRMSPLTVKQEMVTDCSFVASLCICAAYEERFHKPLISSLIYPQDSLSTPSQPSYNPHGQYWIQLWANGVPRKVEIDDRLPVSENSGKLLVSCTTTSNELWVSLIEKAYLKLNGGYDYPGGNSGIDVFALTGWIPECIQVADVAMDASYEDLIWDKMQSAFHFGDCILTMSTGDLSREVERDIGLVSTHVYAILNVHEVEIPEAASIGDWDEEALEDYLSSNLDAEEERVSDNNLARGKTSVRLLQVQNPWRKRSWKGPFSSRDLSVWQSDLGDQLRKHEFYMSEADEGDDGMFWIDLNSVKEYFDCLYLNWNPELFQHKYITHSHWPMERGPRDDTYDVSWNPQYALKIPEPLVKKELIWLLISRHVCTLHSGVKSSEEDDVFHTLHVYKGTRGERVHHTRKNGVLRGTYNNNPHVLIRLEVGPGDDAFTVVVSQYDKWCDMDYTLSVFSSVLFQCHDLPLPSEEETSNE